MLTFADFCAGIGGFRIGLEQLGWKCVYACDLDEQCEETYVANFGTRFDLKDIFDIHYPNVPYFDVLCSGFPCQPFSVAGKRLGLVDYRGTVLLKLLEIISKVRPPVVFFENVTHFVSHNSGTSFQALVNDLSQMDYDVHYAILDSAYFGIPQQRKRVYIVAFQRNLGSLFFVFTKKRTASVPFRNSIVPGDQSIPISSRWQEYIDLYTGKKSLESMSFKVPKTRTSLERINTGVDLENCVLQLRSSGIRACSVDAPLPTFAVSHSGGGAMIPVYTGERRHLSVTEMKRIMGFPDTFQFPVARTHAVKQLSNAVCPAVISSIGQDIVAFLQSTCSYPGV